MPKRFLFITAALVFLCSSAWAQLANTPWPKKHRTSKNSGYTSNFGTTSGKLKWIFRTDGFGEVTGSPILDNNGKIYFGSFDNNFYAVYRDGTNKGTLAWKYKTGASIKNSSAAIDINGIIYIGSLDGYLYAFDTVNINTADPQPLWKYDVGHSDDAGITSSPVIDNSGAIIICSNNGYVYAINPNGTLKWRSAATYGSLWATPIIDEAASTLVFGSLDDSVRAEIHYDLAPDTVPCLFSDYKPSIRFYYPNLFGLDLATGSELWYYPAGCTPGGLYASPVLAPNGVYQVPYKFVTKTGCDESQTYPLRSVSRFFQTQSTITRNYPTDNSCTVFDDPPIPIGGGFKIESNPLFWSTPAVIYDNTLFLTAEATLYQYLPGFSGQYSSIATVEGRIESSPVVDGVLNAFFGSDHGKFYCVCTACSQLENIIKWTYPPGDGRLQKFDNSSFVEIKSTPSIDNDDKHSVYVGANNGAVYAFWDGPTISGIVRNEDSSPLPGVEIRIKNNATQIATQTFTNSTGEFTTSGLDNGLYTVTPQKDNTVFTPSTRSVTINNADAYVEFTASLGFILTGKVVNATDGAVIENVTVTIKGKNTEYTTSVATDSNGAYSFPGIGYDTYTITPSLPGWGFDPPSITLDIPAGTAGGKTYTLANFEATLGYQISGKVIDPTNLDNTTDNGIENVRLTLTGDSAFTPVEKFTNPQGMYSFTGLPNGTYTVTPSLGLYKFSPKTLSVAIKDASALSQNFYGATGLTISGTIKLSGTDTSFDGFKVNLYRDDETFWSKIFNRNKPRTLVATATVASNGFFIFMGIAAGKYIVEPSAVGYGFNPASIKVSAALTDVANLMFSASVGFSISGRFANIIGISQSGIKVSLINDATGSNLETTSALDGSYTFNGLEPGTYTVMPEPSNLYTVSPTVKSVTIALESQRKINFLVFSICTQTYITLPFWGTSGSVVYVIGSHFGPPPSDNETSVAITLSDGTETSKPAGVYFGTNDPTTWVSATLQNWTPFYITVKVPLLDGRLMRVWVVRGGLTTCINIVPTNFFINTRM